MKKTIFFLILFSTLVYSAEIRSGADVSVTQTVTDDLIVAGGNLEILAPVHGDLVAAGGTILVDAPVDGKIVAAGGEIIIQDSVSQDVVAAGGRLQLGPQASVGADLVFVGAEAEIDGDVSGDFTGSAGKSEVSGNVGGSVNVEPMGFSELVPIGLMVPPALFAIGLLDLVGKLIWAVGLFAAGLALLLLWPKQTQKAAEKVYTLDSALWGTFALFVGPVLSVLLFFTVFGIYLGFSLIGSGLLALLLSRPVFALATGKLVDDYFKLGLDKYKRLAVGVAVSEAFFLVPLLGTLAVLFSIPLGFGGIILLLFPGKKPAPLPGSGKAKKKNKK